MQETKSRQTYFCVISSENTKKINSTRLYILLYFGNFIWEQKNEIIAELVNRFNYYCDNIFTTFIFFFLF